MWLEESYHARNFVEHGCRNNTGWAFGQKQCEVGAMMQTCWTFSPNSHPIDQLAAIVECSSIRNFKYFPKEMVKYAQTN